MFSSIKKLLTNGPTVRDVQQQSLDNAQFQLEEHTQAVEFHKSMVDLYTGRIARLSATQPETK